MIADEFAHELAVYDQPIDALETFTNNDGEYVWVSLAGGQRLELLRA